MVTILAYTLRDYYLGGNIMKAGLIGLGAMGLGMARNVAKAGLLSAVYNRTTAKANVLAAEMKIKSCDSPQQLAEQGCQNQQWS